MMATKPEMTAAALVELLQLFRSAAIPVWLDGGWGVDALLENQTRAHKDVDIILLVTDAPKLQQLLAMWGFAVQEGKPPHSFVLADGAIDCSSYYCKSLLTLNLCPYSDSLHSLHSPHRHVIRRIDGVSQPCSDSSISSLLELLAERFGVDLPARLRRGLSESKLS